MVKGKLEPATDLDFLKLYGVYVPDNVDALTLKFGSYIAAMGGYMVSEDGRAYGFIDIGSPMARTPILYRRALRFLDKVKADGFQEIWTVCDKSKPNAERFLLRLGFEPTNEFHQNFQVWRKWLL